MLAQGTHNLGKDAYIILFVRLGIPGTDWDWEFSGLGRFRAYVSELGFPWPGRDFYLGCNQRWGDPGARRGHP